MMKEMKGVSLLFSETGTEGGWWAMQQDGFVTEDGHWRYEGLECLKEGDEFTVYADDGSVLWHGIIHQYSKTGRIPRQVIRKGKLVNDRTWKQQVVGGMWVHWIQKVCTPNPGASCSLGKSGASLDGRRNSAKVTGRQTNNGLGVRLTTTRSLNSTSGRGESTATKATFTEK